MKLPISFNLPLKTAVALLLVTAPFVSKVAAQAPPGPLPQTPSNDAPTASPAKAPPADVARTKNLAGTWRLSTDDSDDPRKKLQQARGSGGTGQGGGGRRSGGMGVGWPGGGMGGRGGTGGRGGGGESDSDRQKMELFLQPAQQLTVAQKEPEIDVTDDEDRKYILYTDNRKVEKSKDASHQELTAKWDEYRLTAEGKDPLGNKYQRSYEVLEGNRQLRETLFLKVGRNQTEISIRYVYDLVSPPAHTQSRPSS